MHWWPWGCCWRCSSGRSWSFWLIHLSAETTGFQEEGGSTTRNLFQAWAAWAALQKTVVRKYSLNHFNSKQSCWHFFLVTNFGQMQVGIVQVRRFRACKHKKNTFTPVKQTQFATVQCEFFPRIKIPQKRSSRSLAQLNTGNAASLLDETLTLQSVAAVESASCGSPADPGENRETVNRWSVEAQEVLTRQIKPSPAVPLTQKNSFFPELILICD